MKDFVVLVKQLKLSPSISGSAISADSIQLSFLMQETYRVHPHLRDQYEIDEKTIQFQAIDGKMCVVFLAFRKVK